MILLRMIVLAVVAISITTNEIDDIKPTKMLSNSMMMLSYDICSGIKNITLVVENPIEIRGPAFIDPHPDNLYCELLIGTGNKGRVVVDFHIAYMRTGDNISVFDGDETLAPLIARFVGDSNNYKSLDYVNVSSSGNWLRVVFNSVDNLPDVRPHMHTGFYATCRLVMPIIGDLCQSMVSTIRIGSGIVTSPNYPSVYVNNYFCRYHLQAAAIGQRLRLTFAHFETEPNYDTLRIFDGSNENDPLIHSLSGNLTAGSTFDSTDQNLTLVFSTDDNKQFVGFQFTYQSIPIEVDCNGKYRPRIGSGYIQSPNFPSTYDNELNCSYIIKAETINHRLHLHLDTFATEFCCDTLTIIDINQFNETTFVIEISGVKQNYSYRSNGNMLELLFRTDDGGSNLNGFHGIYHSVNDKTSSSMMLIGNNEPNQLYEYIE